MRVAVFEVELQGTMDFLGDEAVCNPAIELTVAFKKCQIEERELRLASIKRVSCRQGGEANSRWCILPEVVKSAPSVVSQIDDSLGLCRSWGRGAEDGHFCGG